MHKFIKLFIAKWQDRRDSNPRPSDLESLALPLELLSFSFYTQDAEYNSKKTKGTTIKLSLGLDFELSINAVCYYYSTISVTTPAPTVRPPSRIAKRNPISIAIGVINSTLTSILSPGITISVPAFKVTTPVTSVVRK